MILNNKVLQKLEIIGFKESVKKSTSRIQVYTLIKKFVPKNIPSYNSESKFVHQQIFSLIDSESNLLIALLLLSSKVIPPNMVLTSFQHETWMHIHKCPQFFIFASGILL